MNKKKFFTILLIILVVLIILGLCIVYIVKKYTKPVNTINEYTPEQEMSDDEMRKTIVSIYFKSIETNTLVPEAVCIDVKELADNPYSKLITLLLSGPSNDKLECPLPEGTKINNAYLNDGTVYIDFYKEFIDNAPSGVEEESLIVYSIVNTLTELNEVSGVKILINGEENSSFSDNGINFKEIFVRND